MNSKELGKATNGQFAEILATISGALVTVLAKFDAKELYDRLRKSGGELTLNLARVFEAMLNYEIITSVPREFDVWKEVTFDDDPIYSPVMFLESHGYALCGYANILFSKLDGEISYFDRGQTCFVKAKVSELGFEYNPTFGEVFNRAKKFGLHPFDPVFVPQLRHLYRDQVKDEMLIVAMLPIKGSRISPSVFTLECDHEQKRQVGSYVASSNDNDLFELDVKLSPNSLMVFAKR